MRADGRAVGRLRGARAAGSTALVALLRRSIVASIWMSSAAMEPRCLGVSRDTPQAGQFVVDLPLTWSAANEWLPGSLCAGDCRRAKREAVGDV
jgi:hypothetical protein